MIADRIAPRALLERLHLLPRSKPAADANGDVLVESAALKTGRRRYFTSALLPNLVTHGLGGGMVGALLVGGGSVLTMAGGSLLAPIVGGALGVAIGVAMALEFGQKFKGTATIDVDGHTQTVPWFWKDTMRSMPDAELKASLLASGALGDHIPPGAVTPARLHGEPDADRLQAWEGSRDKLLALAEGRQLVADLGARTKDGKPALQLVSGPGVRELLARNQPVYVVSGQAADTAHKCQITTANGARDEYTATSYDYTQRKFDYTLVPLHSPADLDKIPAGQGVPDGMVGVLRDHTSWSEPVFGSAQRAERKFVEHGRTDRVQGATHQSGKAAGVSGVQSLLSGASTASMKPWLIAGGIVGSVVAAATGLDPITGIVGGVAAFRVLGGIVTRRTLGPSTAAPMSSGMQKVLRVATTVAGAALGLGLALHPLGAGVGFAGLALGLFGGIGADRLLLPDKTGQYGTVLAAASALVGALAALSPTTTLAREVILAILGSLAGAVSTNARLVEPRT